MNDIVEMLTADQSAARSRAQANRAEACAHGMGWVGDAVDLLRANGFPSASVAFMDDGNGWTRGKRDPGPWVDGDLIVRVAAWNARVFGTEADEPQRDRIKRLRKVAA